MKRTHIIRKCVVALLLTIVLPAGAATTATVTVTPATTYQTVGGIGGGIVFFQDWITNHRNKTAIYDTLFNGLGLSCLRLGNWAIDDTSNISNDVEIYNEAKKRLGSNLTVLMAAWTPPAYLKACNSLNGSNSTGKGSLRKINGKFDYAGYAAWWKKSLARYQQAGLYPDYISIQNEPDEDASDYASMLLAPSATSDVAAYGDALTAVYNQVKTLSKVPKFLGADNLGIGWNQTQNYINALNKNLLAGYAFHYYHSGINDHDGNSRYNYPDDFLDAMKGLATDLSDKQMFMTENSSLRNRQTNDAIYTAWFLANAFNVNRVSYYVFWNLAWTSGNGCISLDKWDATQTTASGYSVQTEYHGLRHFSKFVKPGWKCISSSPSNSDLVTCAFKSADGNSYSVIVINKGTSTITVTPKLADSRNFVTRVIRTVPAQGLWSHDDGVLGSSVEMPANSIVTLTYSLRPKKFIYNYLAKEADANWSNPDNWTPAAVPFATDTAIIHSGEVKTPNLVQTAPVFVDKGATFRVTSSSCSVGNLTLQGGGLKVYTSHPQFTLTAKSIKVDSAASIMSGTSDTTLFTLVAPLSGSGNITKTRAGVLDLWGNSAAYNGVWTVEAGMLRASTSGALGSNEVDVNPGAVLNVRAESALRRVEMRQGSNLRLDANLHVTYAFADGAELPNGSYVSVDYPDCITGSDTLFVSHPYPELVKQGVGSSHQTIDADSALTAYGYSWKYADSVKVDWNPVQPEGVEVLIDTAEHSVYISGTPAEAGVFSYTVATVSIEDSVCVKSGSITVLRSAPADTDTLRPVDPTAVCSVGADVPVSLYPVPACGDHATLLLNVAAADEARLWLLNASGQVVRCQRADLVSGVNRVLLPLGSVPAGVYLLRVRMGDNVYCLRLLRQ